LICSEKTIVLFDPHCHVTEKSEAMCKEMAVILVNKVVDPKKKSQEKWRAKEEERHKGSLTPLPPPKKKNACKEGNVS
jgi:hypothetical protein